MLAQPIQNAASVASIGSLGPDLENLKFGPEL